jgi:[ribosomal protein S18]-alanine N-acetyltransferase
MTTDISIKTGDVADLEAIMPVMRAAFDPAFGEAWNAAQCAGIMSLPGSTLLIARSAGLIAGFALTRSVAEEAELLLLAVKPLARRNGIGKALLFESIAIVQGLGIKQMFLEVRSGNSAAMLYLECGFIEVGRRPHYYRGIDGAQFDAVTYRLQIAQ